MRSPSSDELLPGGDVLLDRHALAPGRALSRRSVLGRLAATAGGLAGAGLAGGGVAGASPAPAATTAPVAARTATRFGLAARDLRGIGQKRGPRRDLPGDQIASRGTLHGAEGREVGTFYSTAVVVDSPHGRTAATSLEQHRFELGDGVIVGSGLVGRLGEPAEFAVIGGTGRYLGVAGSYSGVQWQYHLGGDGTASFVFDLFERE